MKVSAEYFSISAAARYMNMSRTTFYKHIAPEVSIYMIGKRPYIKRSDLERFMEERKLC